jgi:hypothetical protein
MADLMQWLNKHSLTNPHAVPDKLKNEFNELFGDADIMWPQPGGQEQATNCNADIMIYGGAAGAGKSFFISLDSLKWIQIPGYVAAICRKTYSQIFDAGGLWDECKKIFVKHGGKPRRGDKPQFEFDSGAKIFFKHSQHSANVDMYWQGLQAAVIYIDECTQFTKQEFLYIMSRNRSVTGINSYIRATCNPDPQSWVRELIDWWVGDDGYIIPERSGVIRYFIHRDDRFILSDTKEGLIEQYGDCAPKSFTFIRGFLDDNKKLLEQDPGYRASLQNLDEAQRNALALGNWNEIEKPDSMFPRKNFNAYRVEAIDFEKMERIVVSIDPAGSTTDSSDDTGIVVGGKIGEHAYVFRDVTGKYLPQQWAEEACRLYDLYKADRIVAERNYGGDMVASTINMHRRDVHPLLVTATKGKALRAEPVAALYEKGLIHHVGHGLKRLEDEMHTYTPGQKNSPNRLDALVWAITNLLIKEPAGPRIF